MKTPMPVFAVLLFGAASLLISGCEPKNYFDPERVEALEQPAKEKISIHTIVKYRQGNETEQEIQTFTGRTVTINTVPWITSKDIVDVQAVPRPNTNYYDLKIKLTEPRGRHKWIGLSNANRKEPLAFVVDGMFYRSFIPRMMADETGVEVIIDGPFDPVIALGIQKEADLNYYRLNPDKR